MRFAGDFITMHLLRGRTDRHSSPLKSNYVSCSGPALSSVSRGCDDSGDGGVADHTIGSCAFFKVCPPSEYNCSRSRGNLRHPPKKKKKLNRRTMVMTGQELL